jgi:hypothetical protein
MVMIACESGAGTHAITQAHFIHSLRLSGMNQGSQVWTEIVNFSDANMAMHT